MKLSSGFLSIFLLSTWCAIANAGNTVVVDLVPVEGAVSYQVEIKSFERQSQPALETTTTTPVVDLVLETGRYILRTRSIDASGALGTWSEWFDFEVKSRISSPESRESDPVDDTEDDESGRRVEIGLGDIDTPVDNFLAHEMEIVSSGNAKRVRIRTREDHFEANLRPGAYRLRVRTHFKSGGRTSWSEPRSLVVAPPPPRALAPSFREDYSPRTPEKTEILFRWKASREIRSVRLRIYDDEGKIVEDVRSEKASARIALPNDRRYEWSVANVDSNEGARRSFTIGNYTRVGVTPAEAPPSIFAWYRQIFSTIQFMTANADNDANVSQRLFASSGELALGKWSSSNGRGYLAVGALSAIATEDTALTYGTASVLTGQRWSFANGTRLRAWAGLSYHDTPTVIAVRVPEVSYYYDHVAGAGPEFRVSYFGSLTESVGWHLFANGYLGVVGVHTPANRDFVSQDSISYGAQTAWRISPTYTTFVGYTFQKDNAVYRGNPRPDNSSSLAGHYFGVTVQADLERAFDR